MEKYRKEKLNKATYHNRRRSHDRDVRRASTAENQKSTRRPSMLRSSKKINSNQQTELQREREREDPERYFVIIYVDSDRIIESKTKET